MMGRNRRSFWDGVSSALPKSEFGDTIFSWVKFVRAHRRLPSRDRMLFNDQLYRTKLSPEILNPLRVFSTDKEFFKILVADKVGIAHVVPTLAVLHSDADIDSFNFPSNFCAKPTHMSGEVEIVKKGTPDLMKFKKWLRKSHYLKSRERNYKYLKPKVIVEPLIFEEEDISDYRIFCYNGVPRLICVDLGKYSCYRRAFFTTDWKKQSFSLGYPLYEDQIEQPECLNEMLEAASRLSQELNFVRVDFYTNGKEFYLGELTHAHASASQRFMPVSAEEQASEMIFGS